MILGKEMEGKKHESKKSLTSYLSYRDLMVVGFLWLSKLETEGKNFHYLYGMCWDSNTCEMSLSSCKLTWKISDPDRVTFWCQTRNFGASQVVSSCHQMCLAMSNWFARMRSGPKLICARFNIIGHDAKQS